MLAIASEHRMHFTVWPRGSRRTAVDLTTTAAAAEAAAANTSTKPKTTTTGTSTESKPIAGVSWNMLNNELLVVPARSRALIVRIQDGVPQPPVELTLFDEATCGCFARLHPRVLALGAQGGQLAVYDTHYDRVGIAIDLPAACAALDFSVCDQYVVAASARADIWVVDVSPNLSAAVVARCTTAQPDDAPTVLRCHAELPHIFGVGTTRGCFHVFDLRADGGRAMRTFQMHATLSAFAFYPNLKHRQAHLCATNGTLVVYDWQIDRCVERVCVGAAIDAIDFSADGRMFAIATSAGSVMHFDVMQPLQHVYDERVEAPAPPQRLALKFANKRLVPLDLGQLEAPLLYKYLDEAPMHVMRARSNFVIPTDHRGDQVVRSTGVQETTSSFITTTMAKMPTQRRLHQRTFSAIMSLSAVTVATIEEEEDNFDDDDDDDEPPLLLDEKLLNSAPTRTFAEDHPGSGFLKYRMSKTVQNAQAGDENQDQKPSAEDAARGYS